MQRDPLPPLRPAALLARLVLIGVIVIGLTGLMAYARGFFSRGLTPARFVDQFEEINGRHPGFRRNHAKGLGASGYFDSNGQGQPFSKAAVFAPGRVPVLARFALAGGMPYVADDVHTVRSLALLFQLPHGEEWRTGMINLPVFPARTPQAFYDLQDATAPDPATGKPDAAATQAFFAQHPESARAMQIIQSQPPTSGFADTTYNALNAFRFVNAEGKSVPVRWSIVPVQPTESSATTQPGSADKNFLFDDLIAAVHAHPLQWHLILAIGEPSDPTADPTLPWPPERRHIDVGTVTIDHIEGEATSPARDINFDPLVLPAGIEPSDDPIPQARSAAYARSFSRREREHKEPSAVSTMTTTTKPTAKAEK